MRSKSGLTRRQLLNGALAVGGAAAFTSVAAGCGASGSSSGGGGGKGGGKPVTAILDVSPYGKHAPFYVALEKGYWSDGDLDVTLQSGKGSADAISKLGSGTGMFALGDTSTTLLARGNQGLPVLVSSMFHYKNLMSVITIEGTGVEKPVDLEGKNMHVAAGEGTLQLLPLFAEVNDFDDSKVKKTVGEFTQIVPSIIGGQVDGALTYYTVFPALEDAAKKAGKKATGMLYADNGVDIYNNGIIITEDTAEKEADAVKAFNDGFGKAVKDCVDDPDEATEIFMKQVPGLPKEVVRAQLQVALDHLMVPEVAKVGFGPMDDEKMKETVDLVNKYFDVKKPVSAADVYTNDLVSKGLVISS